MSVAMSVPVHVSVLLDEVVTALQPRPGGRFIDCTVGLGGHAAAILEEISPSGSFLGIDADPEAIRISKDRLSDYSEAVTLVNDNFIDLEAICERYHIHPVDGILFDLGVSSLQLDTAERGYIKGKSAIAIARKFGGRKRNFSGERFWARGYAVSTVGFEEEKIRHYMRQQEQLDKKGYDEPEHEQADEETDDLGIF